MALPRKYEKLVYILLASPIPFELETGTSTPTPLSRCCIDLQDITILSILPEATFLAGTHEAARPSGT